MQVKVQLFGKAEDIERTLERIAQAAHIVTVSDAAPHCPLNDGGRCGGVDTTWVYRLAVIDPDAEGPGSEVLAVFSDGQKPLRGQKPLQGQTSQSNQLNGKG